MRWKKLVKEWENKRNELHEKLEEDMFEEGSEEEEGEEDDAEGGQGEEGDAEEDDDEEFIKKGAEEKYLKLLVIAGPAGYSL